MANKFREPNHGPLPPFSALHPVTQVPSPSQPRSTLLLPTDGKQKVVWGEELPWQTTASEQFPVCHEAQAWQH